MRHLCLLLFVLSAAGCVTASPRPVVKLEDTHQEPDLLTVRHTVAKGDTLFRIARAYGLKVEELMSANGIENPSELQPGQQLWVPGAAKAVTLPAQDTPDIEPKPPSKGPQGPVQVGHPKGTLQWPLRGVLYARHGRKGKEPHDGIDLAAPKGTVVKTAAPGTVLYAGEQKAYGLIVIVEHPGGLVTLYAHNHELKVKSGQKVREGQVIATVGESGRTSGPHLHFEVRKDGVPVDPLEHLGPL
ncbi:MAG: LysM peptidoglycan-binding domain-containing M23 family metallopeptidase [Myxococcaceae bacterium]|nr:LysM peptidoglycan-binding domain-containing M23 family metallopeptidase [Myxococcaceae bacterium]